MIGCSCRWWQLLCQITKTWFGFWILHWFSVGFSPLARRYRKVCCKSLMRPGTGWVSVVAVPLGCLSVVWHSLSTLIWEKLFPESFPHRCIFSASIFFCYLCRFGFLESGCGICLGNDWIFCSRSTEFNACSLSLSLFRVSLFHCSLCKIHGVGSEIPRKSLCTSMRKTCCLV